MIASASRDPSRTRLDFSPALASVQQPLQARCSTVSPATSATSENHWSLAAAAVEHASP